jgi:hypothetical protein
LAPDLCSPLPIFRSSWCASLSLVEEEAMS